MTTDVPPEPRGHLDGVVGILQRDAQLLLVSNLRSVGGRAQPVWDLPGGRVEPGESLPQALDREWREEVGLEARIGRLRLVVDGSKRRFPQGPPVYTWRAFYFDVEADGEPRAGEGIEAVRWVAAGEAATLLDAPYHAPFLGLLAGEERLHAEVTWLDPHPPPADKADLDVDLRRLVALSASAAVGSAHGVRATVAAAREAGISSARIEEALLQVVPYAGFPRTITAFGLARPLLGPYVAAPQGAPHCATGPETFARVYAGTTERVTQGLRTLHPDLLAWTHAFAYGRVLARHQLTLLEREVLAVGILTAMGDLESPLLGHMRAAVRLGATRPQLDDVIDGVRPWAPPGALRDAHRLLDRLGEGGPAS